ncbi:MAG: hypothetical protein ACRETD_12065 [Steroidobacteraceae bacterium]
MTVVVTVSVGIVGVDATITVGVGVGAIVSGMHGQLALHAAVVSAVHSESQASAQQNESKPHTHAMQVLSSHAGPPCAVQQSPPNVGVGVALGIVPVTVGVGV